MHPEGQRVPGEAESAWWAREGVVEIMDHPSYRAKKASYQDFREWFEGFDAVDWRDRDWRRALGGALRNSVPEDRVAIANLLLDHGADASEGGVKASKQYGAGRPVVE